MAKKKNRNNQGASTYTPPDDRVEAGVVDADYELQPRDEADAEGLLHDPEAAEEAAAFANRFGAPHPSPIVTSPSEIQNPYMREEEQGMQMRPAVVGPPGYGSPDPTTSAGRLLPIEQHPLRADALPEDHPAAISEDYGLGFDATIAGNAPSSPLPPSDLNRHENGDFSVESNEEVDATEGARELANAEGVDLNDVQGTGQDGRVTKDDVESYLADDNA